MTLVDEGVRAVSQRMRTYPSPSELNNVIEFVEEEVTEEENAKEEITEEENREEADAEENANETPPAG